MEVLLLNKAGGRVPQGTIISVRDDGAPWGTMECLGAFIVARVAGVAEEALMPTFVSNGEHETREDGSVWDLGGTKIYRFVDLGAAHFVDNEGADFDISQLMFVPWFVPRMVDPVIMDFPVAVEPQIVSAAR